jgi:hypothetical protein
MYDVKGPYCDHKQEINHDDGYGYSEDEIYEQECSNCGKTFIYTTSISFYYEVSKAPCKNGKPHKLKDKKCFPEEFAVGKKICEYCGEEIVVDKEASEKAINEYFQSLK